MDVADRLPDDVARELDRIRDRWTTLPLARAEEAAPSLAALVEELGACSASAIGCGTRGPTGLRLGVLPDALAVVVRDCALAGVGDDLAERLADLRRSLP